MAYLLLLLLYFREFRVTLWVFGILCGSSSVGIEKVHQVSTTWFDDLTVADCATSPLSIQIDNSNKKSINWCWMNNVQVHSSVLSFTVSFTVLQQKKLRHQVPPGAWFTSLPTDGTVGSPSLPTLDVSVVVIGQCPGEWMRRSGTWVTSSFVDLSCVSFTCSPWPVVPLVHVIRCAISTSPLRGQQHPQRHFFDYNLAD